MINNTIKFGLVPGGSHLELKNLFRLGDAIVLFDTETTAREWLNSQIADNKAYFKVVSISLSMDEKQYKVEEVDAGTVTKVDK